MMFYSLPVVVSFQPLPPKVARSSAALLKACGYFGSRVATGRASIAPNPVGGTWWQFVVREVEKSFRARLVRSFTSMDWEVFMAR